MVISAAAALILAGSTALAARPARPGYRNYGNNNNNNQTPTDAANTPAETTGQTPPRGDVSAAQAELSKANKAYADLVKSLNDAFEKSADFTAAQQSVTDAAKAHDAARAAVITALQEKPEYKTAQAAEANAKAKLTKLREDPATPDDQIKSAAEEDLGLLSVLGKMERDAVDADPAVHQAIAALAPLQSKVIKLRSDFRESLKKNTELLAAKTTKDEALVKLSTARNR